MQLSEFQLRQIFHDYDSDRDGFLTRRQLKLAVIAVFGYKPSSTETRRLVDSSVFDEDVGVEKEAVSLAGFLSFCQRRQAREDSSLETRRVFNALDQEARGFLTAEDVVSACQRVAPGLTEERIKAVVAEVDVSGHGRIALGDFFHLYHMAQEMEMGENKNIS